MSRCLCQLTAFGLTCVDCIELALVMIDMLGKATTDIDLEFDPETWEAINQYLADWDAWRSEEGRSGRPQFTESSIYLAPLTIAVLRSEKRLERLTWGLIGLTIVLGALTLVDIVLRLV